MTAQQAKLSFDIQIFPAVNQLIRHFDWKLLHFWHLQLWSCHMPWHLPCTCNTCHNSCNSYCLKAAQLLLPSVASISINLMHSIFKFNIRFPLAVGRCIWNSNLNLTAATAPVLMQWYFNFAEFIFVLLLAAISVRLVLQSNFRSNFASTAANGRTWLTCNGIWIFADFFIINGILNLNFFFFLLITAVWIKMQRNFKFERILLSV